MKNPMHFPMFDHIRELLKDDAPPINGLFVTNKNALMINSPELLNEIFITKAKF